MTGENAAPAEMPGEIEVANALIAHFVENTGFTTVEEDETKTRVSAYYGGVWVDLRVYPMARAVLALFAPILAEKEREIATFENREAEWNEAIACALQNEEDANRKLEAAEAENRELKKQMLADEGQHRDALAAERERAEQLHATIRKAHVAMTMACALPGVASEYDFSEAIASTEAALARRAAAIRAEGE